MAATRRFTVAERRSRIARRHGLARAHRAADVVEAARRMVCLHGTDPATIFLSAQARVAGMTVADLERALYLDRSLVKHLAMRRTLFVFPRERLADAQAGASDRVAAAGAPPPDGLRREEPACIATARAGWRRRPARSSRRSRMAAR